MKGQTGFEDRSFSGETDGFQAYECSLALA